MIPVPPCYYIMPLHLAGAFFCSLPRKIFLPREENIFSSRGKLFLLTRGKEKHHTWERKMPHVGKKNTTRGKEKLIPWVMFMAYTSNWA